MRFGLLGPLEVSDGDGPVPLGGPKQRVVLAHLVLSANRAVPTDRLIDALWGESLPEEPMATLRVYVSRLRSALGQDAIEGRAPGYLLHADPDEVDSMLFEELIREARRDTVDPRLTVSTLDEALELWRGPALADLATEPSLSGDIARLEELRLQAVEEKIAAQLALGQHGDVVAELEALTVAHPLRERVWAMLMLALYRSGRQADALGAFQRARELLADELGIDPTRDLQELQEQILRHDAALDLDGRPLRGYRLLEQIGEGSFGVVHRAIQPHVGREVAIKSINPELANDPEFVRRFEAEAQIIARLESPHIVPLYDYWRDPDGAFLVMRYLSGGSLRRRLQEERTMAPEELSLLVDHVSQALSTAHRQGIVHRDVKPENVLLDGEGNAYLTDFGIAKDVSNPQATKTGPLGTPVYLSPEQIRGEPVTPQTDGFALGVLIFEALTGRQPFPDGSIATLLQKNLNEPLPPVRETRPELSAAIDDVIAHATQKDPALRFSDASALAAAFRDSIGPAADVGAAVADSPNPFKGLRPFVEADAGDFFGREALVQRLVERFDDDVEGSRFLAVVGPSGSGKSSAVRAGLVPALRRGALKDSSGWFYVEMAPGAHPLEELEAALLRVAVQAPMSMLEQLERDDHGLHAAIKQVLPAGSELVLVIDQLEEVFTLVEDESERRRFLDSVRVAVTGSDSRVRIVTTLRADFYDRPLAYRGFAELVRARTEPVVPLTPEELERAISGPAQNAGVTVEPSLVAQVVADVSEQPGALPLLQYALTELFDGRSDGALTAQAYREIGGVSGALARRAEQLFEATNAAGKQAAEQLFLRLVALGEGTEDTRRRVSRSELDRMGVDGRAVDSVINSFARRRLLSLDRDPETREPTVEVAHEALLREWDRLHGWIDAARDDLRTERRLAVAAADWEAGGRDRSFLLRGSRLEQFSTWASATTLAIARAEQEFLDASLELAEAERISEDERVERERVLERRSVRRLRTAVAIFAIAALVAAGLTVAAVNGSERADREAARAEREALVSSARELAIASVVNVETDPELAILLALEAIERTRSLDGSVLPEAEDALHRAVGASRIELTVPGVGDSVVWSPEGVFAAESTEGGGIVEIRDGGTGAVVLSLAAHEGDVTGLAFSPDGTMLATTGTDGRLNLWDASSGASVSSVRGEGAADALTFDRDGSRVAAVWRGDRRIRIAVPATGEVVETYQIPTNRELALSPDLRRAVVVGARARVIDLRTGDRSGVGELDFPSWSPDGRYIAGTSGERTRVIDATTLEDRFYLNLADLVYGFGWSPDSRRLVTAGQGTAKVWSIAPSRARELMTLGLRFTSPSGGAAFSPDGSRVIVGSADATTTKVWDVSNSGDAEVANIPATHSFSDVAFMPDGDGVAVQVDAEPGIAIWELAEGRTVAGVGPPSLGFGGLAQSQFDVSPDGTAIATTTGAGGAAVWDVGSGEQLFSLPAENLISLVDWSPDGTRVVMASLHGWAKLFDPSGRELQILRVDDGYGVGGAMFTPDGRRLVLGALPLDPALEPRTTIWDLERGEVVRTIEGAGNEWFAISPDGARLVTTSFGADGPTEVWSLRTGSRLAVLADGSEGILGVAFSPDGSRIAAAMEDSTVRLFDAASGEQLVVLRGHAIAVAFLDFSPDGSMLVSGSADKVVRVWAIDIDDLIEIARQNVTRSLTDEECRQYLHVESCSAGRSSAT